MMVLPKTFQFSQSSLQDFKDCRRRFQLRYIEERKWPALETEPAIIQEQKMRSGARFHRLIHQHQLGIAPEILASTIQDKDLDRWWNNYLQHPISDLPEKKYVEFSLSTTLNGYRLVAKYDLLAIDPGKKAVIIDWKTSEKIPNRELLGKRLQTLVYPYLLVTAGLQLNNQSPILPEQVKLVYWFVEHPDQPQIFQYSSPQYEFDQEYLKDLIGLIHSLGENDFPLTDDDRRCKFCQYRTLCGRGVSAGPFDETSDLESFDTAEFEFDLEQIGEISF